MKKISKIFAIIHLFLLFSVAVPRQASAEQTYYAKVDSSGVYLCSMPSTTSALFEIPESYFVCVEGIVDEFYKVTYKSLSGYVLRESVTLMSGTPSSPFASATFSIYVPYSLYSTASETTALSSLSAGQVFTYYGTKTGSAVRSDCSTWFYCSVETTGGTLFGYIYSEVTDHLTTIATNTETFSTLSDDVFNVSNDELASLPTSTKIMLIVAITLPSVLILYFLIKPSRIMRASKGIKKPKRSQTRAKGRADYFEFNESDEL